MARARKHDNAATSNPAAPAARSADAVSADPDGSTWAYAVGTAREHTALEALQVLARRNDGWFRMVPHEDGQLVYAKWKFTSRKWPNHYVMYRCDDEDYTAMLWGLVRKVEAVDAGLVKPTYDVPYGFSGAP